MGKSLRSSASSGCDDGNALFDGHYEQHKFFSKSKKRGNEEESFGKYWYVRVSLHFKYLDDTHPFKFTSSNQSEVLQKPSVLIYHFAIFISGTIQKPPCLNHSIFKNKSFLLHSNTLKYLHV